ncbi:MAG TPA: signal peptidase I [Gemmataceae bacterium]|nr:signal peptidase I [Gemmataceae bacterium]
MFTIALVISILIIAILLTTVALWLGGRWVKAGKPTFLRAFASVVSSRIVMFGLFAAALALPPILDPGDEELNLVALLALIPAEVLVTCVIIKLFLRSPLNRSILAWLVSLISMPLIVALLYFVVKPKVAEPFIVPANSMAPSVVGWHQNGVCPNCGGLMFLPANTPGELGRPERDQGICTVCLQVGLIKNASTEVEEPDRVVVNKLLMPARWDIIVFRYPVDPNYRYIKRVVGLPGETVFIEDGAIFINGERQTPPGALSGLKYTRNSRPYKLAAGTRRDPYVLGEKEYFVLGDYSVASSDSRHWGPVPRENIEGVVTLRYWPPPRWHIFR